MGLELAKIESSMRESVSQQISLLSEGVDRFRVFSPFMFEDGDHFSIVLKKEGSQWKFTDEAHTIMHLSYEMDIPAMKKGNSQKIITNTISNFGLVENDGELAIFVENENFGGFFYNFVQALMKITDVSYLSKEIVRSTFYEDFRAIIVDAIPEERLIFDFSHEDFDREKKYLVDCRINSMPKPVFLFAIPNDNKCRDVIISLLQFERWGLRHQSVSIFEDQETINRRVLAKFSDVGEKQFSALHLNQERIKKYLLEQIQ